ncbi:MAG: potassium channel family protein [Tepidiformaceae bacterium]
MDIAILGLGRFGSQLAYELNNIGVDVLVVDNDPQRVNALVETSMLAAEGDITEMEFLESLSLQNYDSVVVAIGSNIATSTLIALTLKRRLQLPHVIAKSSSPDHTRALELAGVDTIVNPESESAQRLAHTLGAREISDYMSIGPDYGIARVTAPFSAVGSKIGDIDMAKRYDVFLIGRLRNEQITFNPPFEEIVEVGDLWIVSGKDQFLRDLQQN